MTAGTPYLNWFSYYLGRQHAQGGPSGQGIAYLAALVAIVFGLVAAGFTYWNGFRLIAFTIGYWGHGYWGQTTVKARQTETWSDPGLPLKCCVAGAPRKGI